MNLLLRLSVLLTAVCLSAAAAASDAVPGGVYVWEPPPGATEIKFRNKPVMTFRGTAFVGVPISAKLGVAELSYQLDGDPRTHRFDIADKAYTEQHISIENQAMVDPPAETLKRIREESRRQRALYNTFNQAEDLSTGFAIPLEGVTTSLFGHRRFFNGQPRNPHSGLDIAADTGTPVHAAGDATVTLADDLYFNGNTLFLDHGQGLVTMYCHLSERLVKTGDQVKQGQPIGLVGATGRVTGPHLHWSVSLNGNRVDPTVFMDALNQRADTAQETGPE